MDWAQKRKIIYASVVAGVIVLLAAYPMYKLVSKPATCFDKKQNGTETGVDCGGVCALMCSKDVKPPRVVWAKVFSINGSYDIGAYMENVNTGAGLKNAHYTIRVIGSGGKVLIEKKGITELAPASRVLIFETGIVLTETPERLEVLFDSGDLARWLKATTAPSPVVTKNQILKNVDTKPRFDATLVNTDPVNEVADLTLSAIVYDASRYPVAISKTFVENIPKEGEQSIFFTWPSRFTKYAKGASCPVPVDTVILLDHSGSMDIERKNPAEPLTSAKNAAKAYLSLLNPGDKASLITFAATSSMSAVYELSEDFSTLGENVLNIATTTPTKKGAIMGGNLGDAIKAAVAELQSSRHTASSKQAIIAFTDGNPGIPVDPTNVKNKQYALDYAATAAGEARRGGASLFALGFGAGMNASFLQYSIAGSSAHYFSTSTPEVLQTIYKEVSEAPCPPESFITEIVVTPRAIFAE
ncbi:MAG: VWA domain-containing protein [Candidatus Pacebacteria bacterium]|jgi:hypothetical protein|nr:VWA domain-containing protein [Candidatus Paceibacterota bacterium]